MPTIDRLTKPGGSYCDDCGAFSKPDEFCEEYAACRDEIAMYDRLAAYEDTGLEPEEVKSLKETWDLFGGADGVQRVYVERDEYKQAESEGRLIVLPCKVGDTVWTMAQGIITHATVTRVKSPEITMRLDAFGYGHIRNTDDFGQTIFATREEAEAALGGDGDG